MDSEWITIRRDIEAYDFDSGIPTTLTPGARIMVTEEKATIAFTSPARVVIAERAGGDQKLKVAETELEKLGYRF